MAKYIKPSTTVIEVECEPLMAASIVKRCPHCSRILYEKNRRDRYCRECGHKLVRTITIYKCSNCNHTLEPEMVNSSYQHYCPKCGHDKKDVKVITKEIPVL